MKPLSAKNITKLVQFLEGRDDFVFLDCARVNNDEHRSFLFTDPQQWLTCNEPGQTEVFLEKLDSLRSQGYFTAGWLGYEFGYLLEPSLESLCPRNAPYACLGVFESPTIIDHNGDVQTVLNTFISDKEVRNESSYIVDNLRTNIEKDEYLAAIERIKKYIVAGDTYQVNYTMKLLFDVKGSASALYSSLRQNQSVSYGAWIRRGGKDVMSFSPELFFRAQRGRITVRPMKGTMKRGKILIEDIQQRSLLHDDLKNRSENVMIVDLLRNDLGRLLHSTGGGKVQPRSLFDIEVYDTVLQMTSTIDGIPANDSIPGMKDVLPALFPCGSVTGAPKIRTMEIIHELEKEPRGVYCGAIGFSGPEESIFNVPIRTVVLENGKGEMGIGSGIVFDSEPEAEWQESMLKARFIMSSQPDFQLIETLLWRPESGYWLLEKHLERLANSAEYFLFPLNRERVVKKLSGEEESFVLPMRVRLLMYRDGRVLITATVLDPDSRPVVKPEVMTGTLPKVIFSEVATDPGNVHLYHKTTNRKLYEDERNRILNSCYYEVLFNNLKGEVTEGSISNIFILSNGRLLTPPITCGLLAGTFRNYLLELKIAVEQTLSREDIETAEAVYVGNSVRGLVQVDVV